MSSGQRTHRWERFVLRVGEDTAGALADCSALDTLLASELRPPGQLLSLPQTSGDDYQILGVVAEGGSGQILEARDRRLDRRVALKRLRATDPFLRRRFEAEVAITARLQHPSIVPIYEAGQAPSGAAFYAMRLVDGDTLRTKLDQRQALRYRLELLRHVTAVAEAIAYVHGQGVAHGDLKPANILLGAYGETLVIDWGLARLWREDEAGEATGLSGTPSYMAPELVAGALVNRRTDVYALGAILYELLGGRRAHDGKNARKVLRAVLETEPLPLRVIRAGIPSELLAIVDKAMARDPAARYPSAAELAEDLRRFETGQIVSAHVYSRTERIRRFVRRHRLAVAAIVAGLTAFVIAVGLSFQRMAAERDRAERNRMDAEEARAVTAEAQRAAIRRADELTLIQARTALRLDPNRALGWLNTLSPDFNAWSRVRLIALEARTRGLARVLRGHTGGVTDAAFSPDGELIVTVSDDRTLRLWDAEGAAQGVLKGHTDEVWGIDFSRDGKKLLTRGKDPVVRLWDLAEGTSQALKGHREAVYDEAFLVGDTHAVTFARRGQVMVWDLDSGSGRAIASNARNDKIMGVSPDGRLVAYVKDAELWLYDARREVTRRFPGELQEVVKSIAFSASGEVIAVADMAGRVWGYQLARGRRYPLGMLGSTPDMIEWSEAAGTFFAFTTDGRAFRLDPFGGVPRFIGAAAGPVVFGSRVSPAGDLAAIGGADGVIKVWDQDGALRYELRGHQQELSRLRFSANGERLVSCSIDATARVWDLSRRGGQVRVSGIKGVATIRLAQEGRRAAVARQDGALELREGASKPLVLPPKKQPIGDIHWAPDHDELVVRYGSGRLIRYSARGDARELPERLEATVTALAPMADDWVIGLDDGRVLRWRGDVLDRLWRIDGAVELLAVAPDQQRVAVARRRGTIVVIEPGLGQPRKWEGRRPFALAFGPGGRYLMVGSENYHLSLIDTQGAAEDKKLVFDGLTEALVLSPDGRYVAHLLQNRSSVRILDWAQWKVLATLKSPRGGNVRHVAFDASGQRFAMSTDAMMMLWDLTIAEGRELPGHHGAVTSLVFSGDGTQLVSAGTDGTVRVWDDELPREEAALRRWVKGWSGE